MKKQLCLIWLVLLLTPLVLADDFPVDVNANISTKEIKDAYVVGDFFYYDITLSYRGEKPVNNTFTVNILKPNNAIVSTINYPFELQPNTSVEIITKGATKGNETNWYYPFDIEGDYEIEIVSAIPVDFYRWFPISNDANTKSAIRQTKFTQFFDVMPRWQYTLWKRTEKTNEDAQKANDEMLKLNKDANKTNLIMLVITFFALFISGADLIRQIRKDNEKTKLGCFLQAVEIAFWLVGFYFLIHVLLIFINNGI
jgi:hypothetical protein